MATKPHKRQMGLWRRRINKVKKRKLNPPVRGRKVTLQELNRPVIESILSKISV